MRSAGRRQDLAQQQIGDAEGALLRQRIGHQAVGHVQHVLVDLVLQRAVVGRQRARAGPHLAHHLLDEEGLELLRRLGGLLAQHRVVAAAALAGIGRAVDLHQITCSSPSSAPAWSSAWRMAMMSSGLAPMLLIVSTMDCRLTPAGQFSMRPLPWSTATRDCGVTCVWPWPKAFGWLTWGRSLITTFNAPCETAAGRTRTPSAMTTVPVRELKTTLGVCGPTS